MMLIRLIDNILYYTILYYTSYMSNSRVISVVIPLYNKKKSIISTLQSVIAQTYTDWELIVVDDGSTDDSLSVVQEFLHANYGLMNDELSRIRIISKENGGVCSARNYGIREAQGEYIALLDADDIWDKDYLAEQIQMIRDFPDAVMWGINFAELSNGKLVRNLPTGLLMGYRGYVENYFQMKGRVSDLFCSSSVVIRKDVFENVGGFDERIKYAEDNDMWFRIIATNKVAFYDRYMVYYIYDAENRALKRKIRLKDYLPFFVDKYKVPVFRQNDVFYQWINQWSAQQIRRFFFSSDVSERGDALIAVKKLDYDVIPSKYRYLYKTPRVISRIVNKIDRMKAGLKRRNCVKP